MEDENRYLKNRSGKWHYRRRIPKRYSAIDDRHTIQYTLHTSSIEIARLRRDAVEESDNLYWASLAGIMADEDEDAMLKRQYEMAKKRYNAAVAKALARSFIYEPADRLAETAQFDELMERIEAVKQVDTSKPNAVLKSEASALLGGESLPPVTVSAAFDIYCTDIAADELVGKSETQIAAWRKTKNRGVQYFIDVVGNWTCFEKVESLI